MGRVFRFGAFGCAGLIALFVVLAALGGGAAGVATPTPAAALAVPPPPKVVATVASEPTKSAPAPTKPVAAAKPAEAPTAVALPPVELKGTGPFASEPIRLPSASNVASFTHGGSRNFAVNVYRGSERDLLINHIGAYEGERPLTGADPVVLNIEADGPWTVRIEGVKAGGAPPFSGKGDRVSATFTPPGTGPWEFSHDGQRNYVVYLHCRGERDLVQNRIGVFSGSKVQQFGQAPCFWEVHADGNWSLTPR